MDWIFLSPHFDDAALSCGGLIWELAQSEVKVSLWTVCAGEPPPGELSPFALELQTRWGTDENAPSWRGAEDIRSCRRLGAESIHLSIPDCIYRRDPQTGDYLYTSNTSLTGPIQSGDAWVIHEIQQKLQDISQSSTALVCPLALGGHVDHQLTRQATQGLGIERWYYADYPYVIHSQVELEALRQEGWLSRVFPISAAGLTAWQDGIALHRSQISTFWKNEAEMRQAVEKYLQRNQGIRLWKKPGA